MRVAAGAIARNILGEGVKVRGALVRMGCSAVDREQWDWSQVDRNPFFCPDAEKAKRWADDLDRVQKEGSSIGGVVEIVASGVPPGLGEPIFDRLDADLGKAILSIPAVRGVEIGKGFEAATLSGPENADPMRVDENGDITFVEQRGRNLGRHLGGSEYRRARGHQANQLDPDPATHRNAVRTQYRNCHQGAARPLRRHSRRSRWRSHGSIRVRADARRSSSWCLMSFPHSCGEKVSMISPTFLQTASRVLSAAFRRAF